MDVEHRSFPPLSIGGVVNLWTGYVRVPDDVAKRVSANGDGGKCSLVPRSNSNAPDQSTRHIQDYARIDNTIEDCPASHRSQDDSVAARKNVAIHGDMRR